MVFNSKDSNALDHTCKFIYASDLPHAARNSVVSMYACDTSLCYQASDVGTLNKAVNNDLIELGTWLKGNKLPLNVAKSKCYA